MATLIGAGSHSTDLAAFLPRADSWWTVVEHHSQYKGNAPVLIGVNDPRLRAQIAEELKVRDLHWIHPKAWFSGTCGAGTHINYGVTATRTTIGHHCTISPGVTICGDVTIGDRVLIGAGATICDRVSIHDDATVGAGAVVLPETIIGKGETWVGVPARVLR